MLGDLVRGGRYALSGFGFVTHRRLVGFVLIPLFINTLVFGLGLWWLAERFDDLMDALLPSGEGFAWLRWVLWPLFFAAGLLMVFYTFTLLANLIGSPFNGMLSERVEQLIGPARPAAEKERVVWKEMLRAPLQELRKLAYFVLWAIPLLALFFVPGLQLAAPLIWGVFSAWMLALEYSDYPLGNRGLEFPSQRRLAREHWALTLGFGFAVLVLTLIPVVNFLVMPTAVIGATRLWVLEGAPSVSS